MSALKIPADVTGEGFSREPEQFVAFVRVAVCVQEIQNTAGKCYSTVAYKDGSILRLHKHLCVREAMARDTRMEAQTKRKPRTEALLTSCLSPLFSVRRMMASASVVAVASTCSTITCLEL